MTQEFWRLVSSQKTNKALSKKRIYMSTREQKNVYIKLLINEYKQMKNRIFIMISDVIGLYCAGTIENAFHSIVDHENQSSIESYHP